jgi:hypothetical protein
LAGVWSDARETVRKATPLIKNSDNRLSGSVKVMDVQHLLTMSYICDIRFKEYCGRKEHNIRIST